jgi:hypothetical protein
MNWRDHPFAIAVLVCVGTLTIGSTLISQFVIPTWLQSKDNQITVEKTQIQNLEGQIQQLQQRLEEEPKRLKTELEQLHRQLHASEADNLKVRRDLDSLDPDSLFSAGNVYPRGLRGVRIGDRLDVIARIYTKDVEIEDNDPFWIAVILNKPQVFDHVAYYCFDFDKKTKAETVQHVLFQFHDPKTAFDVVKKALVEKYGEREMKVEKQRDQTVLVWPDILGHRLELDAHGYHITMKK